MKIFFANNEFFDILVIFMNILRFIKSFLASHYYYSAHRFWCNSSFVDAFGYIDKAIQTEPDEKLLPRYLLLKGELETVTNRSDDSKLTLKRAKELVEKYPDFWNEPGNNDVVSQLNKLIEQK